ncbi:MAG: gamma-glutamyltransferase family protein [Acidobacteria bacterium]|nr:gamma-glutamyltransferase family protein [Acidobacteriota bacterium]
MSKTAAFLGALLLASHVHSAQTMRAEINAKSCTIAAGRHFAVEAGMRMFRAGGNAFDAGAAAVLAASVSEIQLFGFGGEAPVVLYDARSKKVLVVNGQGVAPAAATPEIWAGQPYIDYHGPRAATVPAVLDSMSIVLSQFGSMRLADVLAPAIDLADGFPMYDILRDILIRERRNCERYPTTMAVYYPGGRVPELGEMFHQPDLARTLRAIAAADDAEFRKSKDRLKAIEAGRNAFYRGEIARRLIAAARDAGGIMTEADLAGFRGRVEEPVHTMYRGYSICKAGFWTQGPVMLQTLNILSGFDISKMGFQSADYLHTVTEAIKLAFDDRDAFYGDPDFSKIPIAELLSESYAAERRTLIDPAKASKAHRPGSPPSGSPPSGSPPSGSPPSGSPGGVAPAASLSPSSSPASPTGDTTAVNAVDASGNLFSAVVSGAWILDGAFIAGDTGVPLSQRMQQFSLDPQSPNVVAPHKRPRITLTPTVLLKDGRPYMAIATPGGDSQDQQNLNVLLAHIDFGLPIQEAIEAPRLNSENMRNSFRDHRDQPGVLTIEARVSWDVLDELRRRGHDLRVIAPFRMPTAVTAVGIDPATGTLFGGADVRGERAIAGW